VRRAEHLNIDIVSPTDFENLHGMGVRAHVGESLVLLGNRALMKSSDIEINDQEKDIQSIEELGRTAMLLAKDSRIIGIIGVAGGITVTATAAGGRTSALDCNRQAPGLQPRRFKKLPPRAPARAIFGPAYDCIGNASGPAC